MRILLVCHGYPPYGVAGVERLSAQTAEALVELGHEVTVFTRRTSAAPPTLTLDRSERNGVSIVTVVGAGSTFGRFPGYEAEMEIAFTRMLAETAPDVALLSHLMHHSPGYVAAAHRMRVPAVLELHDFFVACPLAHLERVDGTRCTGPEGGAACAEHCFAPQEAAGPRWSLRAHTFRHALRTADAVVCPSRFVADYFGPLRGDAPIEVVGNGVPPSFRHGHGHVASARDPQAPLDLVSIGVVVPHKGQHVLLEALRLAELPRVRCTLLGATTTPYDRQLREAAEEIEGLSLAMVGRFEPEQLPGLLHGADAVVIPSLVEETYSIAAREAFACGVPVIGSRIGALPEGVRDGENGLLFTPGDAAELALLLQNLDRDRTQATRLAAGIRPDDAITVTQRTAVVERVLADVVAAGAGAAGDEDIELRLIRDGLAAQLA